MIPWILGLVIGVALLITAIWLVVRDLGSDGGGAIQLTGISVKTGSTAALALILGFGLVVYSLYQLDERIAANSASPSAAATESPVLTGSSDSRAAPQALNDASLSRALMRGIATARASGGTVQAAVWVEGADQPVIHGDSLSEPMRPWSMVRVATTIAAYRATVARGQPRPSTTLAEAIRGTIVRAENCAHHRVVLGLQELTGGRDAARTAVTKVFADAGARGFEVATSEAPADASCRPYLENASDGLRAPFGIGVQFGTSSWTIANSIAFAHELSIGTFGDAGDFVLGLMREAKKKNRDPGAARRYTAPLDWGAGSVLDRWDPAYKGGWGGASTDSVRYLAGQLAVLEVAGQSVAIVVVVHPDIEPSSDDPGSAGVVGPIEAVLIELAQQFKAAD